MRFEFLVSVLLCVYFFVLTFAFNKLKLSFYPRDAMLARVLAMALCLSVSLSVTSRCSSETAKRIGLFLGMGTSLTYPTLTCKEIRVLPSRTVL